MNSIEPKVTMGVVAFPNPDKEKHVIRFIDSSYNDLFIIPDGDSIILTHFNGSQVVLPCTYIDDYHAKIGNNVYHICEFAEIMEHNGTVYAPKHPKRGDICDTYEIYQISDSLNTDYLYSSYEHAKDRLRPTDYIRVYAGVLAPNVTMETLFTKHNRDNRPFGKEMRSMSMSDVLVIKRGGQEKAFYVDRFGFQETKRFLQHKPKKKERGNAR